MISMQNSAKTLAGALIAGLVSGSLALADENVGTAGGGAAQSAPGKPTPSPKAIQRKPHKEIKNKNACCKNGCDCMDPKTGKPTK